jgi:hypothetical protein
LLISVKNSDVDLDDDEEAFWQWSDIDPDYMKPADTLVHDKDSESIGYAIVERILDEMVSYYLLYGI